MSQRFSLKRDVSLGLLMAVAILLVSLGLYPKNKTKPLESDNIEPPIDPDIKKTELVITRPPDSYFHENKEDMIDFTGLYTAPKEDILTIQTYAQMAGYVLDVDGLNGKNTQNFIKNFQISHGLPVTGFVDRDYTLALIKKEAEEANLNRERDFVGFRYQALKEFEKMVGIQEEGCNNCGEQIEIFLRSELYTGPKMAGQSAPPGAGANWCAGAISYGFQNILPGLIDYTLNAKAAAFDHVAVEGLMEQGLSTNSFYPYDGPYNPRPGDIIVFDRGSAWNTWRGHAGVVKWFYPEDGSLVTLEGNVVNQYYEINNYARWRWTERYPDQFREKTYTDRELRRDKVLGFINVTQLIERRFSPEHLAQLSEIYNLDAHLAQLRFEQMVGAMLQNKKDTIKDVNSRYGPYANQQLDLEFGLYPPKP